MNRTSGTVYNIQRFCLHDGEGVRTVVFLKGCPLHCLWCCNPESQSISPQLMYNHKLCRGCLACVAACPNGAITALGNEIEIDRQKCRVCGLCTEACSFGALNIAGKIMTMDDVMCEVRKDRRYYDISGGGMTISGGEPTMQHDFSMALLKACHREGIRTAMETCGECPSEQFSALAVLCDEVLFDIKLLDPLEHQKYTGAINAIILKNLRRACSSTSVTVRVPLIPTVNVKEAFYSALTNLLKDLSIHRVELLPYHKLGAGKYEQLGIDYKYKEPHIPTIKEIEVIQKHLAKDYKVKVVF